MIKPIVGIYLLGSVFVISALPQETLDYPVVDLGYAKYRGVRDITYGIDYYYGIRYAVAPEGDLRWRAPREIESHGNISRSDIINATAVGPQCAQGPTPWADGTGVVALQALTPTTQMETSEDCLLLNVLAPTSPKSESLPVVVYIHGGGECKHWHENHVTLTDSHYSTG